MRFTSMTFALALFLSFGCFSALHAEDAPAKKNDEVIAYFDSGKIPVIKLIIPPRSRRAFARTPASM